jgi:2-amino-4-hydroxy-6-hydroxymethyldihydropteridine diphosphokinase
VLLLGERTYESERLRLPHPEVSARRFVLVPLLELAPELVIPGDGRAADALAALGEGQAVRRAGPPLDVRP